MRDIDQRPQRLDKACGIECLECTPSTAPKLRSRKARFGAGLRLQQWFGRFGLYFLANETSRFQRLIRASLFHGLQAFCRDVDGDFFAEFGNEKRFLLQIHLTAARASWIELRRTRAIRIPPANLTLFTCYRACSRHMEAHATIRETRMQLIYFVILIFSIILHEVAHGYAADKLGDPTARYAGRLTLNPIPHIDFLGSIILPIISVLSPGGFLFGWAKPVPYNPYNLVRAPRWGETIVAAAGPGTNFALVLVFAVLMRLSGDPAFGAICFIGILVNLWLGLLNLIPIPPLDGSKVLEGLLPRALSRGYSEWRSRMEYNPFLGFGLVLILIVLFGGTFGSLIYALARLIAGM